MGMFFRILLAMILSLAPFSVRAQEGIAVGPIPPPTPGYTTGTTVGAGYVGQVVQSLADNSGNSTYTVTSTTPAVFTCTGCNLVGNEAFYVTTTNTVPTGLTINTTYYVLPATVSGATFQAAATEGGTALNTSSTGVGTQTMHFAAYLGTGAVTPVTGVSLTAGNWNCWSTVGFTGASNTVVTAMTAGINTSTSVMPGNGPSQWILGTSGAAITQYLNNDTQATVGPTTISVSSTTPFYLLAKSSFSTGASEAYGSLLCQRTS